VGIEAQAQYLATKKTWTRKIVLVTDGENPIEAEDCAMIVQKMDSLNVSLTVVYVNSIFENVCTDKYQRNRLRRRRVWIQRGEQDPNQGT
jgi:ATP-dependent DNA helicase 2 subunit 2